MSKIGLIGLGKMGYNLALNFKKNNFDVVAYDVNKAVLEQIGTKGIETVDSLEQLVQGLSPQRVIWIMVPAGNAVDAVLNSIREFLDKDDILIDGGNSFFKDSITRAKSMKKEGVHFLDCGTSGGVEGALSGVCSMIGGDREAFTICEPVFKSISVKDGYLYCGESGSGHFTKMIHNGIEYGMMQSIAEGFEILHTKYPDMDLSSVSHVWNHGSVIRSWLMELTQKALEKDTNLGSIKGVINSSGEGKWTVETALELGIPAPVITQSLLTRFRSKQDDTFSGKIVAALRNEFGGHTTESKIKK